MNEPFEKQFETDTREHGIGKGGSDFWKPADGQNKLRILVTPEIVVSRYKFGVCYDGAEYCKKENLGPKDTLSYKWLTWIIDRADGKLKLYSMPFLVAKALTALKTNDEYGFVEFPMPYDITLDVKGAGTKEVVYSVLPARKETALTEEESDELEATTDVSKVIDAMKDKARKQHGGEETASEDLMEDYPEPTEPEF